MIMMVPPVTIIAKGTDSGKGDDWRYNMTLHHDRSLSQ
jgi:hypothetical protein